MARTAATPPRRRQTTRPQLAGRDAFESALEQIAQMPPKAARENIAGEYLPRFVAKLRELRYSQDDIVKTIVAMNLGVTERQIRAADSAWTKEHGKTKTSATGGRGGASGAGAPGSGGITGSGGGTTHAGLAGAGALRR